MGIRKFREQRMNPGERTKALLRGQAIDQVGLYLFARGFCARNIGMSLGEFYTDPEKCLEAQIWTAQMYGNDENLKFGFASSVAWDFGGDIKMPSAEFDQTPMVVRYPVQSEADGWKLEIPQVKGAGMVHLNMAFCRLQEKKGLVKTISIGAPFMNAANVCGLENLLKWMYKKPDLAHHLLRLVTDYGIQLARYWVETFGPENIEFRTSTPTSSNQVISPKHFEAFSLPYLKELHETVLEMGVRYLYTHICGEQNLNLPYYKQIPFGDPGIASFGHEVDLAKAIEFLGDRCIIVGNVEPRMILMGSPDEVYEISKQCIEKGKKAQRGFMLGPGCELPPTAPACNVWAMRKAIDDFG
ncbi:MAG: uroporphyrinogen decarboxylase family protein [Deltaproteobacteria bacterium]|nr:uroporphyrinogen decarboxylase family protein [Deltaproteobacteria bacterium]